MALKTEQLDTMQQQFHATPTLRLAQNAATRTDIKEVLVTRDVSASYTNDYSHKLMEMKATAQKASGRCWLFAACNVMRKALKTRYDLKDDFELSPTYLFFYDKVERANYFLETMLNHLDEDIEGRLMSHLLSDPLCDGGQWDMVVNLVEKYGIVPASAYPETAASGSSRVMNGILTGKLREFCCLLHDKHKEGASADELRQEKDKMLRIFYDMVAVHLGTPPKKFSWRVETNKKTFLAFDDITPLQFYHEHIEFRCDEWISIVNDPRNPYKAMYTVDLLSNVVGGVRPEVRYLNLPSSELRRLTVELLNKNQSVWFGCDVGKEHHAGLAVMDDKLFDYELVFGTKGTTENMNKAQRLRFGQSLMTHAMVFTGYDRKEGAERPTKFRVENSWGTERGDKGYYLMTDTWFDEYLYQIIVPKSMLSEELAAIVKEDKVHHLPPWDPMGALA